MIKLFFSDLDGTLWKEKTLGEFETRPGDLEAIRRLTGAGIAFAVATGRGPSAGEEIRRRVGLDRLDLVGSNGSTIYVDGALVGSETVSCRDILLAAELLNGINTRMMVESAAHGRLGVVLGERDESSFPMWSGSRMEEKAWLSARPDLQAYKLTVITEGEAMGRQILEAVKPMEGIRALVNQLGHVELIPARVSKGAAIRRYCQLMGYSLDQVAFIGDETNDVEAMDETGLSFAMAAARPEVRAHADHVVENVEQAIEIILNTV